MSIRNISSIVLFGTPTTSGAPCLDVAENVAAEFDLAPFLKTDREWRNVAAICARETRFL